MSTRRTLALTAALAAALVLVAGCDSDDAATTSTSTSTTTAPASLPTGGATTTSQIAGSIQPAIWPAADVVFDTPEAAAEDFVAEALGVPPRLGEFQQGDARSGEIEVLAPDETTGDPAPPRSVLLLRQLGPDDGWFVIGAANEHVTISTPAALDEVAAGPITVAGVGRGFEANVVVTGFVAGDPDALDENFTQGGAFETAEPYRVTLDLSAASPGDVVTLLVRGGTGLETDPGEFSAIPVVIAA